MSEIWLLSAKPNIAVPSFINMNVDFISNGTVFHKIYIGYSYGYNDDGAVVYVGNRIKYDDLVVLSTVNGEPKTFTDEAYRTLIFYTSPTGDLLTWLQANADKQVDTEYLTRKSELTSVADAIREKSGQTGQLIYPDGFASAVAGIKKAPTTPYMEAEYIAVEKGGSTSHYIKRAKLYNHTAIYANEFHGQDQLQNLDFSDASNNITVIEANAFEYALVNGLVLPNTISVLGPACFDTAYITTLVVPPLVTVLPDAAFAYIQPVHNTETGEELPINIILPQNLTKIGYSCFNGASIKQITIPDTVTEIVDAAFLFCRQLESITCLAATPPALGTDALYTDTAGFIIKVPAASVAAYKAATNWSSYADYIVGV